MSAEEKKPVPQSNFSSDFSLAHISLPPFMISLIRSPQILGLTNSLNHGNAKRPLKSKLFTE
jgi:hypothetical protein